jgi:hypothetical protein
MLSSYDLAALCDQVFADEGCTGIEIHQHFKGQYWDSAMSRSEVCKWIRDIKGGRENGF